VSALNIKEFAYIHGISLTTAYLHRKQGYCNWPRRLQNKLRQHSLYGTWAAMIRRCYNNKVNNYKYYGGRGISVSAEWRTSFKQFLQDMENKPGPEYTLDRIDNNKGYCKENCRWATLEEQQANKRVEGVSYCRQTERWKAEIQRNKKKYYLGIYRTVEEAKVAYIAAKKELTCQIN
jgi:hypothetical protein